LTQHQWRGNVRELENTVHRAVLLANGDEIGTDAIQLTDMLDRAETPDQAAVAGAMIQAGTENLVGRTVAEVERELILDTLNHCLGNRTHAATILGISIRTLRNKLKQYTEQGVPVPLPGESAVA
jgi:DNA-binding NtrC family response regulator